MIKYNDIKTDKHGFTDLGIIEIVDNKGLENFNEDEQEYIKERYKQIKSSIKTFKIDWDCDEYGYVNIQAKTEEEAEELFYSGEFEEDLIYKGGNKSISSIKEL